MFFLIPFMLSAIAHASFMGEQDSRMIISTIRTKSEPLTEYMASNIAAHSNQLNKRGFVGNIKQKLHDYIQETYTDQAIKSFQPQMEKEMDSAFHQYYRYTKRDTMLTPEQVEYRKRVFGDWLSKRLEAQLKNHMVKSFGDWTRDHTLFGMSGMQRKRATEISKRQERGMQKRYIERTPKNEAIFLIVSSFLLIPIFMNPFTIGLWGILLAFGSAFFLTPILHKLTFNTWF